MAEVLAANPDGVEEQPPQDADRPRPATRAGSAIG